jgi:hypothetical protein
MMADKVKLSLIKPTAEGIAALFKKLTGREPDMEKIKAGLKKVQDKKEGA